MNTSVVGIDPGATTGMAFLEYSDKTLVSKVLLQTDAGSAATVLRSMLQTYYSDESVVPANRRFAGIERFVEGGAAARAGHHAKIPRQLVMELSEMLQIFGYVARVLPAADVKPWATDKRLEKAGLVGASAINGKSRDAYDAARHALFTAHWAAKIPDPLA